MFLAHYPQVYDTLPISRFSLEVARMSNREEMGRLRGGKSPPRPEL